jgi:hypothetical protein
MSWQAHLLIWKEGYFISPARDSSTDNGEDISISPIQRQQVRFQSQAIENAFQSPEKTRRFW